MKHRLLYKTGTFLLVMIITILPIGLSLSSGLQMQNTYAFDFLDPLDFQDNVLEDAIPDDFISDEDREQIDKSFQVGTMACAAMTYIMYVVSAGTFKVPIDDFPQSIKENFLDCIFYNVINVIIENVIRSLTRWVQSGFEGNPAFTTNYQQMARQTVNQMAGEFIGTRLEFLCSPFKLDVQLALSRFAAGEKDTLVCTLDDILGNAKNAVTGFVNGDFLSGGWDGWFTYFLKDNAYSQYEEAEKQLVLQIRSSLNQQAKEIDHGRGWLSIKRQDCWAYVKGGYHIPIKPSEIGNVPDAIEYECDEPRITTPGGFVEESIQKQFGIAGDRLAVADEINELVWSTMTFLIRNILYDERGLAGYNPNNSQWATTTPIIPGVTIPTDDGGSDDDTPGDEAKPGPLGASACFAREGIFHSVIEGGEQKLISLPLPANTSYERIVLDLDVFHGGWNTENPDASLPFFWLARSKHKNLFGLLLARGPGRNLLVLRHGLGQSHGFKPRITKNATLQQGNTYHVHYEYDVKANTIETVVSITGSGEVISRMTSTPDVSGINVGNQTFLMTFGARPVSVTGNPTEPPPYGWKYSDLKISFISNDVTPTNCASPEDRVTPGGGFKEDDDYKEDDPFSL